MCETGSRCQVSNAKSLGQSLAQVRKGGTNAKVDTCAHRLSICQERHLFARMICTTIRGIDTMISSKEDGIARAHYLLHLGKPVIDIAQSPSIALAIAAMAP